MKVLWLSPTPSLSETYLDDKPVSSGWIKSLEKGIQDKVDLSVAFYHHCAVDPFTLGGTRYYPVNEFRSGKLSKITRRIFNKLEPREDIQRFLAIVDEVKPDLIHIHGTENPFGLVQQYTDIPCVISFQGNISVILEKYFAGVPFSTVLRYSQPKNWLFFRTYIHNYAQYVKTSIREKEIFARAQNIIGRTDWDRRVSKVLAPQARYFHNDEMLRDNFYTAAWQKERRGKIKLFTTTGPVIYKGLETVLYCAHLLDLNKIDYQWEIAGVDERDEAVWLAAKTVGRKIGRNIQFAGRLDEHRLAEKLLDSDLYVCPSHIENSPNSLCEALILGMPCVATNAGGTASLLDDGKEGILIQDGDPYAMAGAIIELAEDFDRARVLGENGRERALLRHDSETIVRGLLAIYEQVRQGESLPEPGRAPSLTITHKV